MGLFIRRGSPYWYIDVSPPDGGPRIQQSTKIRHDAPTPELRRENRRLAEAVYHEAYARAARRHHGEAAPEPITFRAFASWYQTHVTAHKRGKAREAEILAALVRVFGDRPLTAVTASAVREWMTARTADGARAATVNRELDVLKHVLVSAVPRYLPASPIARLRRLHVEQRQMAVLSPADEARLLPLLAPADQAIVIAALDTLARASELLRLRWADDHGPYLTILNPKAGPSRRVPVSRRLRVHLDRLKRRARGRGYIFAHRRRGQDPRTWTNSLKQMLEDACGRADPPIAYGRAADGITFHGLRHTGATRMIEAGISLRIVQTIGGWHDLRQLSRYTHPSDDALRAAVESVSRGVSQPDGHS